MWRTGVRLHGNILWSCTFALLFFPVFYNSSGIYIYIYIYIHIITRPATDAEALSESDRSQGGAFISYVSEDAIVMLKSE